MRNGVGACEGSGRALNARPVQAMREPLHAAVNKPRQRRILIRLLRLHCSTHVTDPSKSQVLLKRLPADCSAAQHPPTE